jgi:hypothetical protein
MADKDVLSQEKLEEIAVETTTERQKKEDDQAKKDKEKKRIEAQEEKARRSEKFGSGARLGIAGQSGLIGLGSALGKGTTGQDGKSKGAPETEEAYGGSGGVVFVQKVAKSYDRVYSRLTPEQQGDLDTAMGQIDAALSNIANAPDDKVEEYLAGFKNPLNTVGDTTQYFHIDGKIKQIQQVNALVDELTNNHMKLYWTSNGQLDMAAMVGRAEQYAQGAKRTTSKRS